MIKCDLHKHHNNSRGSGESVTRPEILIKDTGTIMLNVTSPRELIKGETEKTKHTERFISSK